VGEGLLSGGGLDHVLPFVLLNVVEVDLVPPEQAFLVEVVELVGGLEGVGVGGDEALGGGGGTARRGILSRMELISMEGPQLLPSRMVSSRSWQLAQGLFSCW
jgi:hypothetical protein